MKRKVFFIKAGWAIVSFALGSKLIAQSNKKPDQKAGLEPVEVKKGAGKKVNVIGDNMTFKLTGQQTNNQYLLIEENNDPGVMIPKHVHTNEDEVFKVIEGKVEFLIGERKTTLFAGDVIFCPRGIAHSWKVVGDKKAKVDLTIFPAGIENMFEELSQLPAGPPDLGTVSKICGKYGVKFV